MLILIICKVVAKFFLFKIGVPMRRLKIVHTYMCKIHTYSKIYIYLCILSMSVCTYVYTYDKMYICMYLYLFSEGDGLRLVCMAVVRKR